MNTILKTAVATLAFAAAHSALASRHAKKIAGDLIGRERSEAVYRVFYVGQGAISFGALIIYCVSLPKNTAYRIEGKGAALLRTGQVAGLLLLLAGLRELGIKRWSGVDTLHAWQKEEQVPAAPAAQGPELGGDGRLTTGGAFRWSRHPLNFAAVPLFWLTPHMTTRRLAFNAVGTAYLVLGSLHEEVRLRAAYGDAYESYLQSQVPFFMPGMAPRPMASLRVKRIKSPESHRI